LGLFVYYNIYYCYALKEPTIKICHLSSVHFALDTRIFYRMCQALKAQYEVTLIGVHPKKETYKGIAIIPFKRFHNRQLRVLVGWLLMFFKAMKVNARVYHLHDPELIPCGLLLRLFGKQVIWDVHENIAEDIFDKPWIKHQKRAYGIFNFFEKLACQYFYIVLAEKSYEKRYMQLTKRCSTVQNFCDIDFFKPYEQAHFQNLKSVFYIGIVLENRGILQIVEALHLLKLKGEVYDFHCVGELYTDLENKLKALPYYKEVETQLHFHGRLSLEEGYQYAKHCSMGLCIIWPMKNSIESYPTKLFEYMAIGLPVITSNFPLYRSVIEQNNSGQCIDPFSAIALADAIESMHRDVEKSEQLAQNGKLAVKKYYNWETEKIVLARVYEELLDTVK
jgi:glycosyltransferase involved in cell wall biosynthesis